MEFTNVNGDVVAIRLPDGKIKIIKNNVGPVGEIFESESELNSKYQKVNESGINTSIMILESING